jgi:MFS family permease
VTVSRRDPVARPGLTYLILSVAVVAFGLVQALTIPVLAPIQHHHGTDLPTATWVLTAYLLASSVATPVIGRLGDALGKKRLLVVTLLVLTLGSALAAVSPTIETLIIARVVQGVAGGVLPLSFGIIRDSFPAERVNPSISILSSLIAVGMGIGIVAGGPVIAVLGVPWLFWLPCIATGIATALVVRCVPESTVRLTGRPGVLPALLMSASLVALLVGISEGPIRGWTSGPVLGLISLSVFLGPLWVRAELRARVPFVDMRMMRLRPIWAANLAALTLGYGMFAAYAFVPQFMQTDRRYGYGFGADVSMSGLMMLPAAGVLLVTGFLANLLAPRIGARAVVLLGSVVAATSAFGFVLEHKQAWAVVLWTGVLALGVGLGFASLATLVVSAVPPQQTGVASGMNANIRTVGGALGSAATSSILTASASLGTVASEIGYVVSFVVLGVFFLAAAVATTAIPARLVNDSLVDAPGLARR